MLSLPPCWGHSWVSAIAQKQRACFALPAPGPGCWKLEPAAGDEASHHPSDCKYAIRLVIVVS